MAILQITIPPGEAFFTQRVELDGINYLFYFSYNQRADAFYLTISDELGNQICPPFKIVTNWELLRPKRHLPGLPSGELIAVDLLFKYPVPGLNVLGVNVQLYYYPVAS